jgi:hypothetical protein
MPMPRVRPGLLVAAALAAALLARPGAGADGAVVDRLLAAVNGRVITERDLLLARNLNALMVLGATVAAEPAERQLERLIDLEILRQDLEFRAGAPADARKVDAVLADLETAYAEIGGLTGLLRRLGLERSELREYVALQRAVEGFIDSRFRPFVSVAPEEVEGHYRAILVPRLEQARAAVPPLESVRPEIVRIVTEERVTAALERWLGDVRRHSRIEYFTGPAFPGEARP